MPLITFPGKPNLADDELASIAQACLNLLMRAVTDRGPSYPQLVYHYTDSFGLKGIIESGLLRATHIAFMNDATEYVHAADVLLSEVQSNLRTTANALQRRLLEAMVPWLADLQPERFQSFAIVCFSAAENSLNQWRSYARGEGGFAIGFDLEQLAARAHKLGADVYPVVYDPEEQLKLIREILAWALDEYPRRAAGYPAPQQAEHLQKWLNAYMLSLGNGAPLFKRSDFSEEQEWRMVWRIPHSTSVKFNPKQELLSAYTELQLGENQTWPDPWPADVPRPPLPPKLPIRKLWIGPGRYKNLSALAATALLTNSGYWGVEVTTSDVPFRIVR